MTKFPLEGERTKRTLSYIIQISWARTNHLLSVWSTSNLPKTTMLMSLSRIVAPPHQCTQTNTTSSTTL